MSSGAQVGSYSTGEEIANVATHAVGALLSAAGLALLVVAAALAHDSVATPGLLVLKVVSGAVFGATLVLLYSASTVYHAVTSARAKHVTKLIDHASIYLLIAGTYTPFTLITLRGPWGWGLFVAVWSLAVAGVGFEAFWVYRPKWLSATVYLAMGWMVVIASRQLFAALPTGGLVLLFAGGLAYSLGTVFYVMKSVRYMHAVWHLFVLAGSVAHFFAVVLYVMPS
jgi:hemolysin III